MPSCFSWRRTARSGGVTPRGGQDTNSATHRTHNTAGGQSQRTDSSSIFSWIRSAFSRRTPPERQDIPLNTSRYHHHVPPPVATSGRYPPWGGTRPHNGSAPVAPQQNSGPSGHYGPPYHR